MSPSGQAIWHALRRAIRRVRMDGATATALVIAAVVPTVLLIALAWGPARWSVRGPGPLALVLLGVAAAIGLGVWLARRWVRSVDEAAVAAAAERRRQLPDGSLRGVLELGRDLPTGVSGALFRRSEAELAAVLSGATPTELAGDLGDHARRRTGRVLAGALVLLGVTVVAGFVAPERARAAWAPLLRPVAHLNGPSLPAITVSPGDAEVPRGDWLDVAITAPLRTAVTVHWRSTGDVPRDRVLGVRSGDASMRIGPVQSSIRYWVASPDGFRSDTFRITPVDPLLLSGLTVDVTYPAYTGRDADHFEGDAPPLRLPAGSQLRIRGTATRPLAGAALRREADGLERAARVEGASFGMEWRPDADAGGRWEWRLHETDAATGSAGHGALELTMVPDAPPQVTISLPGADTLMPPSLRQQIVADAADDYGIAGAQLVVWKRSAAGQRGAEARFPIRTDGADRTLLRTVLDATAMTLVPGDQVHYRVEVRDNSPGGQTTASATYSLRLPNMAEMRDRAREDSREVLDRAERLAASSRDLASETRDASRKAGGSKGRSGSSSRSSQEGQLGFDEASEAREVLEEHETMLAEMEDMRRRMEELKESIRDAGLEDPELQRRLNELRELYRELATPELQQDLDQLREAVDQLDPEAVRQAMERLAEQQEELREQIEQSLEMMRRAAAQQEMSAVAREAEEVAAQQEALADAMREEKDCLTPEAAGGCEVDRAAQQDELAGRTEQLKESMQSLEQQLMQMGEESAASEAGSAGEKTESAQGSMQQASEQARQQQGEQAAQSGEEAAQQLGEAARQLDQAREQMQQDAQQAMQQAMQQATQEALSMAQREDALRQQMEQAQQQGGQQQPQQQQGGQQQQQQGGQQAQQQGGQQPQQQGGQQQGAQQQQSGQQGAQQGGDMQQMRAEQAALQQGLQQLGRNLSEAGQRSSMMNQEVGQALARATLNMQQTMESLEGGERLPVQEAERTVESLNQLAMSLLQNDAQMQQMQSSATQQAMQQLAELARQQGSLNGQAGSLASLDLARQAMQQQLQQMAQQQRGIARRAGTVSDMVGGQENVLGQLDQLSAEADAIARELEGGRLDADVMARQERLFHRLLDAGRTLEREEYSDERVAERAAAGETAAPESLDAALLDASLRYPVPTDAQLRSLPPAYRRLILDYFNRLNGGSGDPAGDGDGARDGAGGGS